MTSTIDNVEFVDNPDLTWSYVDSITAVSVESKAVCKIELCTVRWVHGQPASGKKYPVSRLALPIGMLVELQKILTDVLVQLESQGAVARVEPAIRPHMVN